MSATDDRNECVLLALERGYTDPTLRNGHLVVYRRHEALDYVDGILAPRGLVPWHHLCPDWREARRLLGMLPPARCVQLEPTRDSLHPQGF